MLCAASILISRKLARIVIRLATERSSKLKRTSLYPTSFSVSSEGYADGLAGDDKVVAEAMAKLTTKEILALGRHFRKGYINSRMF